jgi:hypothetical protein
MDYLLLRYPRNVLGQPKDWGLKEVAQKHRVLRPYGAGTFSSSWFIGGDTRRVQNVSGGARQSGTDVTYYPDTTTTHHKQIRRIENNASSEELQALLNQLPPSQPPAKEGDLLFISFYRQVHLYDRAKLPQAVRDIHKIIGLPVEEFKR